MITCRHGFDGKLAGAVALADVIRPEARDAIADLHAMGNQMWPQS